MTTASTRAIVQNALLGFGLGLLVTASVGWLAAPWLKAPPAAHMLSAAEIQAMSSH